MNYKELYRDKNFGQILFDEDIKNYTTFGIGGKADVMVKPTSMDELRDVLKFNHDNKIETFVMGRGSNLLVSDKGIRGCVILLADNFDKIEVNGDILTSLAGSPLGKAARVAIDNSLSGMEEISGIPGSVGGACAMNAGAYGGEMKDVLQSVKVIDKDLNVVDIDSSEMNLRYRNSRVQDENLIVLEATIALKEGDYNEIKAYQNELTFKRESKQPLEYPSAGSTFKRPEGYYAGKLIDDSGLRGYRYKDAMVSQKHCGFVINAGDANCEQVLYVINHVKDVVFEKFGVNLEPEVRIIGEFEE